MTTYFVTGTDTDVGKTFVSALLVRQLDAFYWKPVQSGIISDQDKLEVQRLSGISRDKILPCTYELQEPLSPHEAARIDGVTIDLANINMPDVASPLVIEGAGGVFVPLNDQDMMIDLIEKLGCEVIVVARSGLGTINHTLLTLNALRQRNIPIKGVVMNGPLNEKNKIAIEEFGKARILSEVTFCENREITNLPRKMFDL